MTPETLIKEAGKALLLRIKQLTGTEAREIRDLGIQIETAFEMAVLSGDEDALATLEARMKALLELSRLTAIRIKEEAIMQSVITAFQITKALLLAI